ncbi:MAG: DMT family transporter [Chloroflexota bacterium]
MKVQPYLILFTGVVAISFAAIFIRLAAAPPLVIATYRLALASVVLVPVALAKRTKTPGKPCRRDVILVLCASTLIALHFGLWITSLADTSIASSVILVTAHPVFVAPVAYFLWGERLSRRALAGILLALAGVVLVNLGGLRFSMGEIRGNLLALAAGFAMGAYLITGRTLRMRIDILSYLALTYALAAVMLLGITLSAGYSLCGYTPVTYLMMLLLALVPQLIGHSCLNVAVRLLSPTIVSVAILCEPVGATLLGLFLLRQFPTPHEIAGGMLILVGIYLTVVRGQKTG